MNFTHSLKNFALSTPSLVFFYFFFSLFCILFVISSHSEFYIIIVRLIISLLYLINEKTKILPSNDYMNLFFNVPIVLTFTLKKEMEIFEGICLALLQNLHLKEYKWKGWATVSQSILSVGLYKLREKDEFQVDHFLGCLLTFFMFLTINNHVEKINKCEPNKKLFKLKSSFFGIRRKKEKLEEIEKINILDLISDSLIFFNTNTRCIYHLNQKALNIFFPSIPSTISDLPSWPLIYNVSSTTMINSTFFLPSILDQAFIFPSKYKTCNLSNYYEVSVHKISPSMSVIRMVSVSNQNPVSSNNLKMLSYVSHEFRTPLNCINTMLDALIRKAPEDLQEAFIIPARDSLAYLLALVNDFLDMSQMMAGKFSLSFSEFKLKQVTKNVIKLMSLQAELKGIELLYEEKGEIPDEIYSDPARLRQVLINLMSNAMKYTSKGWIKLKVDVLSLNLFHIHISDTGLGIKKEDQKKLLLDFGRIKNSEDQSLNNYGVGLGLVISDAIAKELSGNDQGLKLESEWGEGTTFSFYLKDFNETDCKYGDMDSLPSIPDFQQLRSTEERALPTVAQSGRTTKTHNTTNKRISLDVMSSYHHTQTLDEQGLIKKKCECTHILICDDNQFNILSLKLQLQLIGKNCDSASLGEIAIQKVREKMKKSCCKFYKLIFMDLEMPVMGGCETSKKIKEILDSITNRTKIVACSGYDDFEERKKALKAGMEDFLVKPVMKNDLRRIVEEIRERKKIKSEEDARGSLN